MREQPCPVTETSPHLTEPPTETQRECTEVESTGEKAAFHAGSTWSIEALAALATGTNRNDQARAVLIPIRPLADRADGRNTPCGEHAVWTRPAVVSSVVSYKAIRRWLCGTRSCHFSPL